MAGPAPARLADDCLEPSMANRTRRWERTLMPGYILRVEPETAVEGPLWRTLAATPTPASIAELHLACRAKPNAIQHRLSRWVLAGLVTRIEGRPKRFVMSDSTERTAEPPIVAIDGRAKPRVRTARDRMWSAIRVLKRFDLPTLMISSGASRRSAEDFVNCLQRAGYLSRLHRGNARRGDWSRYSLVNNPGPRTPRITTQAGQRLLIDGNTGQRHDISPGTVNLHRPFPATGERGVS